jgi:hypothetical protein
MVISFKILHLPAPYCKTKFSASAGLTSTWKKSISPEILFPTSKYSTEVALNATRKLDD